MDNTLNARIKLKYDTLQHWTAIENTFTPLAGEVILYYIPSQDTGHGMTRPCVAMKVGDGRTLLGQLNWIQAQAGDVYSWAKKEHGVATDITSTILKNNIGNSSASAGETANVQEVLTYLTGVVGTLTAGEGYDDSVAGKILAALNNLSLNDAAIDGQFITEVDQSNGGVSVTRRALRDTDIPNISTEKLTSGTLSVGRGGTGSSSFTSGQVLVGNGTSAISTKAIDTTVTSGSSNLITSGAVSAALAGLTGAMHFIGKSTIDLSNTNNSTANPIISGYDWNEKAAGDVVLNSTGNKEYVWDGSKWVELGDEGSHALNTVTITGGNGLTGGGNLQENRTIEHAVPSGASSGTLGSEDDNSGRQYIQTLTTDAYGHVIGATYAAETVTDTTYTFAAGDADGQIKITSSTTPGIPVNVKPKNLKTIATSASIYDVNEVNTSHSQDVTIDNVTHTGSNNEKYFILDCGNAFKLVDNILIT